MVLCHRLLRIGPNPSTKDAKLIAFRVGEYHPRRVTLPDIGPPSTEGKETFDFCGLIDRTEVRMESVLACLLLRNRYEQQARHPIRSRPDLELVRGVAHDNPSQGLGPPSTKRDRIVSVDDDLLPNEIHVAHSARSVSQADPPTDPNANCCDRLLEGVDERDLAGGCGPQAHGQVHAIRARRANLPALPARSLTAGEPGPLGLVLGQRDRLAVGLTCFVVPAEPA